MPQSSLTLVISTDPDQIWVLLNDMIAHPERYEPEVVLRKLEHKGTTAHRVVSREGLRVAEILEVHRDALMVELTQPSQSGEARLSVIHQVVPSGDKTILNLAATWVSSGEEGLEDKPLAVDTVDRRLARLGERIKQLAEDLAG